MQLDSAWVRRLDALLRIGRTSVVLLALLLGVGLVAITFNTIRLQVMTSRAEIELSRLLGATDAFIRRPFHYFGVLLGLLGGVVAWLIVGGATLWLQGADRRTGATLQPRLQPPPPVRDRFGRPAVRGRGARLAGRQPVAAPASESRLSAGGTKKNAPPRRGTKQKY